MKAGIDAESVHEMLTMQIVADEITVAQAREIYLRFYKRPAYLPPLSLAAIERRAITEALRECESIELAAERLAIGKTTLYRKAKEYGLRSRKARLRG